MTVVHLDRGRGPERAFPARRQVLKQTVATLLWRLDALEAQAEDPEWPRTKVPEVTDAHVALHEAVLALHALGPAAVPQAPPETRPRTRRRPARTPIHSHEPSENLYMPED
ncbi:MAG: hypothetical protein QOE08_1261 [Thermoleophilaceae bacterium]|nr:hypothetical protein [Thermoleophilaceae bacterium]